MKVSPFSNNVCCAGVGVNSLERFKMLDVELQPRSVSVVCESCIGLLRIINLVADTSSQRCFWLCLLSSGYCRAL